MIEIYRDSQAGITLYYYSYVLSVCMCNVSVCMLGVVEYLPDMYQPDLSLSLSLSLTTSTTDIGVANVTQYVTTRRPLSGLVPQPQSLILLLLRFDPIKIPRA